jgi:hypothetical protein
MVIHTEYYTVYENNEKQPGVLAARYKVAHLHGLGIFTFKNLLNQMIKNIKKQN